LVNDDGTEQLNSVKYLYLRQLSEPKDNSLRVIVEEAITNRTGIGAGWATTPELAEILRDAYPIESIEGCRAFELYWKSYVAYLVTEEMAASCGKCEDEVYSGTVFRCYQKSHFLDHLARDTGGHSEPLQHYKITCLNHVIDVAAYAPPDVRLLTEPPTSSRPQ
jgi:hypothetical protein